MEIHTDRDNGVLIARVERRVDGTNALEFEGAVQAAIGENDQVLILNCETLSYISSADLRASYGRKLCMRV